MELTSLTETKIRQEMGRKILGSLGRSRQSGLDELIEIAALYDLGVADIIEAITFANFQASLELAVA